MSDTLSLVLFSGTDDKLSAAAILAAGASALGRPVNVLLQYWALDAFRADRDDCGPRLAAEAGAEGELAVAQRAPGGKLNWLETFRQAKELGEMKVHACAASVELLALDQSKLDPVVDDVIGVAGFFMQADDGQILFI